jgi:1-acyl-sn-glycerol-3-phosphate acyltransferase
VALDRIARRRRTAEKNHPSGIGTLAYILIPPLRLGVKYRFWGTPLPETGPVVIAANHFSHIDPFVIGAATWLLGRAPRFMAKASLFRVPIVGFALKHAGQVPVERSSAAGRAIVAARIVAEQDRCLVVYPEGSLTRDPDLWPMRGKTGAVRIALEGDIPLIPMVHWGTQTLMARGSHSISFFPRNTVDIAVGEPVDLSAYRDKPLTSELLRAATSDVMQAMTDLLAELRHETAPAERWDPVAHGQTETGSFRG